MPQEKEQYKKCQNECLICCRGQIINRVFDKFSLIYNGTEFQAWFDAGYYVGGFFLDARATCTVLASDCFITTSIIASCPLFRMISVMSL